MKARPFLAVVLTMALLLVGLGAAGWWVALRQSPRRLQDHSLQLPLAARFVPRTASLSVHLLVPPDRLAAYARVVAPPRQRRQAGAALTRLRDGAFASAGLDYTTELAGWLGSETSLAVLAPEGLGGPTGWLLALRSRDAEGARRFLQRFWQSRSLAGSSLQISSYRGMGLISGRGALLGQPSTPLATALIEDRLVLIASGRGVLEQALDVSQIDELNQAGSPALRASVGRLGPGIALITARPQTLSDWFDSPEALIGPEEAVTLVAALAPAGSALDLEAELTLREPLSVPSLEASSDRLEDGLRGPLRSLALVQNPAALLAEAESGQGDLERWRALVGVPLERMLLRLGGPLPPLVAAADPGPLLWGEHPDGWVMATGADQPSAQRLEPELSRLGFILAPLERSGRTLEVWTRLQARTGRGDPDRLVADVAGARLEHEGPTGAGKGLGALADQLEDRPPPRRRLAQLRSLETPSAPLQWAMDSETARALLTPWQPWQLLTGLAASPIGSRVQGLALSLDARPLAGEAPPTAMGADPAAAALVLRARLELG